MLQTAVWVFRKSRWSWFKGRKVESLDRARIEVLALCDEAFRRGAVEAVGYAWDARSGELVHQRCAMALGMPLPAA